MDESVDDNIPLNAQDKIDDKKIVDELTSKRHRRKNVRLNGFIQDEVSVDDEPVAKRHRRKNVRLEDYQVEVNDEPVAKKYRGKGKLWLFEKKFDSKEEALNFINRQGTWSTVQTKSTTVGVKTFYRCNKVKKNANPCPASIYLLYHNNSDSVSLFCTQDRGHVHDGTPRTHGVGLSFDVKEAIKKLYENGTTKPTQILGALRHQGLSEPTKMQLNNFLRVYKEKGFVNSTVATLKKSPRIRQTVVQQQQQQQQNFDLPSCTCEVFLKEFICMHALGLNTRLKICESNIPAVVEEASPVGGKRKQQRPRKSTTASE